MSINILVAGGAGFLGSHLCDILVEKNYNVICLDNLHTGSKKNISHLLNNDNFRFINDDIINLVKIDNKIDQIYNLACPASPVHYQKDPIKTFQASVFGVNNLINIARKNNSKILHTSTSEIYGDPTVHPQEENYWGNVNPIGVRSCYDEGKRAAETLLFDYNRVYGLKIKVCRIFNTYGPRMENDDGRVISNFICQAILNNPITVYGDGKQTRSFCYVSDLVSGIYKLMNSDDDVTGPINIGNPNEFTMLELANKIIHLTSSKSKIIYQKLPLDDPKKRKPNIDKATKVLGWRPEIQLDKGLSKTIKYFKSNLSNGNI